MYWGALASVLFCLVPLILTREFDYGPSGVSLCDLAPGGWVHRLAVERVRFIWKSSPSSSGFGVRKVMRELSLQSKEGPGSLKVVAF